MIKASICVAIYNINEAYLKECLNSIVADKSEDIEIILGDDCSTIGCDVICKEYAKADSRIKYLRPKHNGGVSRMRNLMMENASGKYITFVDGDDAVSGDYIKNLKRIAQTDYDIVMFQWKIFEKNIPAIESKTADIKPLSIDACKTFSKACITGAPPQTEKYEIENSTPPSVCTKAYRLDFIKKNELKFKDGLKKSQDVTFNTEAFFKCKKLGYLPQIMNFYRINPTSVCHRYSADFEDIIYDCIKYDKQNTEKFYSDDKTCFALWSKYKLIHFIINNFELNIFHKDNPESKYARKRDFLNFISTAPFDKFFKDFDLGEYNWRERRFVLNAAKNKRFALLDFMYKHPISFKIYGKIKKITDFKGNKNAK